MTSADQALALLSSTCICVGGICVGGPCLGGLPQPAVRMAKRRSMEERWLMVSPCSIQEQTTQRPSVCWQARVAGGVAAGASPPQAAQKNSSPEVRQTLARSNLMSDRILLARRDMGPPRWNLHRGRAQAHDPPG